MPQSSEITAFALTGQTRVFEINMGDETELNLSAITVTGFGQTGDGFVINGNCDSEAITGSSVTNMISGSAGAYSINGGADIDTVSYASAAAVVTLITDTGVITRYAAGDTYASFLKGSPAAVSSTTSSVIAAAIPSKAVALTTL